MENIPQNGGEILDKLIFDPDNAHQTEITMELIEIFSGGSII